MKSELVLEPISMKFPGGHSERETDTNINWYLENQRRKHDLISFIKIGVNLVHGGSRFKARLLIDSKKATSKNTFQKGWKLKRSVVRTGL